MKNLLILIFLILFQNANATIYYVDDASNTGDVWTPSALGDNSNNGTSITTPKLTVANVLSTYVLGFGDIIRVDSGTYTQNAIDFGTTDDGSSSGYVTIQGASNILTVFSSAEFDNTFDFATDNMQYIKIMDLKIAKNTLSYNTINFAGSGINNIWIENCVLTQAANNEVVYGDNPSLTSNSDIKFNNCTIINTNVSADANGIELIDNFDNAVISNNTFTIAGNCSGLYFDNATDVYEASGVSIFANTLNLTHASGVSVRAITMRGKTASSIYGNTINNSSTASGSIGILLDHHNDATLIPNNTNIYSNLITCYGTGINVTGYDATSVATTINIYSNTVTINSTAASHGGIKLTNAGSSGNLIKVYKNRVISGNFGIYLVTEVSYCQINNNYVSNNAYCLVSNSSTNDNTDIYYNSFYGTTNGGYLSNLSTSHNIKNNIFYSTSASATDYALEIISNATLCSSLNYNLYYVPNGARVGYFAANYTTLANWAAIDKVTGAILGEENGQTGNPIYDNAASNDLDIHNVTSKAYHLGTVLASYTTDIFGVSRDGATPNIGAFENIISLPITLISFEGVEVGVNNKLFWSTLSEIDNDFFTIEKTFDGINFEYVGTVGGSGNSTLKNSYELVDYNVRPEINYYRLKQTDYNGDFSFSDIISIDNRNQEKLKVIVSITNMLGQKIDENYKGVVIILYLDGTLIKSIQ